MNSLPSEVQLIDPELVNQQLTISTLHLKRAVFNDAFTRMTSQTSDLDDFYYHVQSCADHMDTTPWDSIDKQILAFHKNALSRDDEGLVDRRGPKNPLRSKKFNKKKYETKEKRQKTADPGRMNIPLMGRQIVNIATFSLLLFVFLQSLVYSTISTGSPYDPANKNKGPSGVVLNELGGLSSNAIRKGETFRLFWACYMHSGWIHIAMNLSCQIQYIYMYEPDWGMWRVICVFFGAALCGNLMSANLDPCMITVGSSGSLFGLMGACVPYCIEYWTTLPRPSMIAIMTVTVMIITVLMGFNESGTDNWAHIGGGVGGLFVGFIGTVNLQKAPECCKKKKLSDDAPRVIRKNWLFRNLQQMKAFQGCKCGWREWALRIFGFTAFFTSIGMGFYFLLVNPYFQPLGTITYHGIIPCCCCVPPATGDETNPIFYPGTDSVQCSRCTYMEEGVRYIKDNGIKKEYTALDLDNPANRVHLRYPCAWVAAPIEYEVNWDEWNPETWIVTKTTEIPAPMPRSKISAPITSSKVSAHNAIRAPSIQELRHLEVKAAVLQSKGKFVE